MSSMGKKAFWVTLSDVATKGFGFLATVYLARVLGAEMYGLIAVALASLGYLMWIADLGLSSIGIRESALEPEKRTFRAKEIFITKLFIGLVVFTISILALPLLELDDLKESVIRLYLIAIIPYSLSIEWLFNGKQEYAKLALAKISQTGIYLILLYVMISTPEDVSIVPKLYLITVIISMLLLFILMKTITFQTLSFRSFRSVSDLIRKGSFIGFGGFFAQTVNLLPPIVIAYSLSLRESGIYAAAFKVILIAMILDKVFVTMLIPTLSKQWSENREQALNNLKTTFRLLLVIGFSSALILATFAEPIIQLLFGLEYIESTGILEVLALFVALTFMNSLFSFGLISINREKEYLKATFFGGLIATVLILGSGFTQDFMWIAASVVVSEFILLSFSIFEFRKFVEYKFYFQSILVTIVGLALIVAHILFDLPILISGTSVLVIFLLIMAAFRILRWKDIKWLNEQLY